MLFLKIQRKQPSSMVSAWSLQLTFQFTTRQMTIKEVNEGFFQPIHPERAVTFFQIGSHNKRSS